MSDSSKSKSAKVRAVVAVAPGRLELQEFSRPRIGPDEGILRVEACGICGTDTELYSGKIKVAEFPFILGHEPLGVIDEIGDRAAARWGVQVGDRVAVEPLISCGECEACIAGMRTACANWMSYGFTPTGREPAVWGAYADYMYLHPRTVVHRMSKGLPPEVAVMFNPLGAGVRWASRVPGTKLGDSIAILGAGQRGLSAVIVAKRVGAHPIIVTDVDRAAHKPELARTLGADHTLVADREEVVARVIELTGKKGADIVLDVAPDVQTVFDAIGMVKVGGTVVLAGVKGNREIPGFISDQVVLRSINVRGVFAIDTPSYREAVRLIEAGAAPFNLLHTASYGLEDAEAALHRLAGRDGRRPAVCVTIRPDL
jgi:threonine dehydrogenase-like Zn-dependent dehydrogenase